MNFKTQLRDCLYLNWALPARLLPPAPAPLRYDMHRSGDESVVFASALLFRQDGLQTSSVPLPRVDAPQFQFHLCTLDEAGVPSVFIRSVLVPSWFAPGARFLTRQPAKAARLKYPESVEGAAEWRWEIRKGERLVVEASIGAPPPGAVPNLGSWEETVAYFRRRGLGFTETVRGMRRVEIQRARQPVTPVRADVSEDGLLRRFLRDADIGDLPPLHSAWLCAPMMISYELSNAEKSSVGERVPAPG